MPSHQAEAPPYYNPTATEEALRESEERYHAMFQYLNSGVAVYRAVGNGEDFVFKDFNEAAERIGRVQKREVLGKRLLEVFPDMDRCGLFSALQRVYRTGRPEHLPPVFYRDEIREGWREDFVYRLPSGDVVAICDDITDRKRAEIALTESEERYRGVVESQTEFITRFTPDFRVTFVNEAFARFFGLDREDIIGMRFRPDIPPEDREALGRHFAALTRERPVGTIEHRIVIPGGQVRWQKWVDRAIFDAAGELVEFQSVGRDTTDRRLAEEALRESEEKYRNVVERANDGITILQDRKLRFVNRRYALLWGGTVEEMVGRDLTDFIHPDEREKVLKRYHQRLGGEKVASVYDTVLLHRDGSPFPAELNSGLISYHGRPAHLVFIRDITERGRAEKALRESQDRYRKIVEGTNAGVWVIADDNSTIYANDQMARMLGREAPGMLGRPVTDFIFPADLPRCEAMLGDLKTGAIQEAEVRLRRRDGSSAWMHLTAGPYYDIDGRHVGCTGVFSDVTERKRAMEELRESEERYRTLIETANEAIVIAQDGILKFVNPRAVEMLETTPEDISSVPFAEFIHPDDR
ncbi:MAG TPA: PAS domain S-box protein, partial [Methanomicrobiales archaeon]|nr:PAS domain S-box protein [Methanomicrobiales archaeon]